MGKALLRIILAVWIPSQLCLAEGPDAETREAWKRMSQLGTGFVVWESNRTGRWRLWRRELDGSKLRMISREEQGRDHFCPHLSPDGKRLVYLSYPAGQDTYQDKAPKGGVPLYLMNSDGSGIKKLTDSVRAYSEDRAAVWLDNDHLIYIDGEGFTRQMDLSSGQSVRVTEKYASGQGFGTATSSTPRRPTRRPGCRHSLYDASHRNIKDQGRRAGASLISRTMANGASGWAAPVGRSTASISRPGRSRRSSRRMTPGCRRIATISLRWSRETAGCSPVPPRPTSTIISSRITTSLWRG